MTVEKCSTCKFYYADAELQYGLIDDAPLHPEDYEAECRRFPPTRGEVQYHGSLGDVDVQRDAFSNPIVNTSGWCGEWRKPGKEAA